MSPVTESPGPRRLAICLGMSILLHIAAGVLLTVRALGGSADRPAISPDEPLEEMASALEELVRLGSQTSTATSITWIGFDEYKQHTARPGKVDQAAFTMAEPGAPTASVASASPGSPVSPIAAPAPPAGAEAAKAPAAQPPNPEQTLRPNVAATGPSEVEKPTAAKPSAPAVLTGSQQPEDDKRTVQPAEAPTRAATSKPDEAAPKAATVAEPGPPKPQSDQTKTAQVEPAAPSHTQPPGADPRPDDTPAPVRGEGVGRKSDRESDPTSIDREIKQEELGPPLSAKGLEIKTVRPRFTHYTRLTARPIDPTVRLRFDRSGKVAEVTMTRSSGIADVDRPLLDALYQWRAAGVELERIPEGDPTAGIIVSFKILL